VRLLFIILSIPTPSPGACGQHGRRLFGVVTLSNKRRSVAACMPTRHRIPPLHHHGRILSKEVESQTNRTGAHLREQHIRGTRACPHPLSHIGTPASLCAGLADRRPVLSSRTAARPLAGTTWFSALRPLMRGLDWYGVTSVRARTVPQATECSCSSVFHLGRPGGSPRQCPGVALLDVRVCPDYLGRETDAENGRPVRIPSRQVNRGYCAGDAQVPGLAFESLLSPVLQRPA
jgi:hypothetical protein